MWVIKSKQKSAVVTHIFFGLRQNIRKIYIQLLLVFVELLKRHKFVICICLQQQVGATAPPKFKQI